MWEGSRFKLPENAQQLRQDMQEGDEVASLYLMDKLVLIDQVLGFSMLEGE